MTSFWLLTLYAAFCAVIGYANDFTCNYVYEVDTLHAYPTDVCMRLGANQYVKYQCVESSAQHSSDYTILMQSFLTNECNANDIVQKFDLIQWVQHNNNEYNTSIQIEYDCSGIDGCFVEYKNECNDGHRYYPIGQCLEDYNKSISFKYECDASLNTFSYSEYKDKDCEQNMYNSQNSFSQIQQRECLQYVQCKSTASPTMSPSLIPTVSPTLMPTAAPSYFVPFKNKSLDAIIDILSNGTYHSASAEYKLSFLIFIVAATTVYIF